jgi:hypothetical protein
MNGLRNCVIPQHIIIKTTNTETQERILKAIREKKTNNIQRKTHQNHSRLHNRNITSKKSWKIYQPMAPKNRQE